MNLVGKIFIVLIFIMSLVFMSFVVAVYATHTNWRDIVMNSEARPDKPLGLKPQLEQQKARNQELSDQLDKLKQQVESEKAAKRQQLAKLETENDELKKQRDQQEKELAKLVQAERDAVAAMDATQKTAAALRTEVDGLREEIRTTQKDRDEQFKKVVDLTDSLHQTVNQFKAAQDRSKQLAADYAQALAVLRRFDLKPDRAYDEVPPKVDGVVAAVTSGGLVEVSIGSDDGLNQGHKLDVYRIGQGASTYLGRLEVTTVQPDKSVCKILPEFQKGQIQVGDRVASKLK
jgi:cell division protein FtsB